MLNAAFRFAVYLVSVWVLLPRLDVAAAASKASLTEAPELSLSLRGLGVERALEQGEPLRVAVRLKSPMKNTGAILLSPSAGTWADAVAVELLAAGKSGVLARAEPLGAPDAARATLDRDRVAGGVWVFPANALQGLATGEYRVRVRLAIDGEAGWSGEAISADARLMIIGLSSAPERIKARTLARAQIAIAANTFEEAARLLDERLGSTPDDSELLSLRAEVALRGGNARAAMLCVNRAGRSRSRQTSGTPPLILEEISSRAFAAQLAGSSRQAAAPLWTWPPLSVMRAPGNDALAAAARERVEAATAAVIPAPASVSPKTPAPVAKNSAAVNPTAAALPHSKMANSDVAAPLGRVIPTAELTDATIAADAAGQWAASAVAGSQYGRTQYCASQATGAPNISVAGNSPEAWCPANKSNGTDWLEVTFAKPVHASEVRVRQNDTVGAITKIEAIESDGTSHVWWEGVDPYSATAVREIVWFGVRVPKTDYLVAKVKITLNLAAMPGWKQIDAVQLIEAR